MPLFAKLLLAEPIKNIKLFRKRSNELVPNRSQFHLDDHLSIRHHHSDTPEKDLQIFRQLLPPRVARIHSNEIPHRLHNLDRIRLLREHKLANMLLLGLPNRLDLHGHDGQDLKLNPIKLIKAPPQPRLDQPLEYLGHISIAVLVRTIRDHHVDAQGPAQILDGFGLAGAGGAGWRAAVVHGEGLG
jgi:hypothetical protein